MKTWCSKVAIVGMAMMFSLSAGHAGIFTNESDSPCPELAFAKKACEEQGKYCQLNYGGPLQQDGCEDQLAKCNKSADKVCQRLGSTCSADLEKAANALQNICNALANNKGIEAQFPGAWGRLNFYGGCK